MNQPPEIDHIAAAALDAGAALMEAGASASRVAGIVDTVARGLGAERIDLRVGYASLAVTVAAKGASITWMHKLGGIGVNQQVGLSLEALARRVAKGELTADQTVDAVSGIVTNTPKHKPWFIAVAVGLACAAFARLLAVDWPGVPAVFAAAAAGQYLRGKLLHRGLNPYLCTATISCLSSMAGSLLADLLHSSTATTAAIASVLLLVPGVPAVNALSDMLEGRPTLGSARGLTVALHLVFISAGLWVSRAILLQ